MRFRVKNVYSVGQVNSYIKNMFTQDFMLQNIYVKGEASNVKYHSSGHIYFTLKDVKGAIACVMFAGNRKGLSFQMKEGQEIIVGGTIDVYERDGKYQLYAYKIQLDGEGILYERYAQLKKELEEMGMFAKEYKQEIPLFIQRLGVVTAKTGAAIQDIIQISTRRNPHVQIILYPAKVQGEGACESIMNGIRALEHIGVDVIIVGRGGGSMEDLWAFNEEGVARAIFDCTIPIISAVGHETDTTIADFVADLRAPTPSAAAELAVFRYFDCASQIAEYADRMRNLLIRHMGEKRSALERFQLKLAHVSPENQLREKKMYAGDMEEKITRMMVQKLKNKRHQLAIYGERLRGLSPLLKLSQGFSYVASQDGKTIYDVDQVQIGQPLFIDVKNGRIKAKVMEKIQQKEIKGERNGGK